MHCGPLCMQLSAPISFFLLFGTIRKKFLLLKTTKNARYVQSLGKNPILGDSKRLKKVLRVLRCAKNTPQMPKRCKSLGGIRKTRLFFRKSAILSIRWKFQF